MKTRAKSGFALMELLIVLGVTFIALGGAFNNPGEVRSASFSDRGAYEKFF